MLEEEDDWIWALRNMLNFVISQKPKKKVKPLDISEKEQMQLARILRKLENDLPLTEDELKILKAFDIDYEKI